MSSPRFLATRDTLGPHPLAVLHDAASGRRVRIAHRGATVLSIEVTHAGRVVDLADGYRDQAELEARPSSRFAVMAPFANRIADARYTFDGRSHDLQPGVAGEGRSVRHGFVRGVDFELVELKAGADGAVVCFRCDAIRPAAFPGYPFAIDFTLRYLLDERGLALEACMTNVGDQAAPCFFGWHPYFRLGDTPMESWALQVPAATAVAVDANLIPLPGAAARIPLEEAPALDYRQERVVGDAVIDRAYTALTADADGLIRSHLRDPATGLALAMWQERGVMLAFTADTVTRDVRGSLALEPMESWSNAFNRPDCAEAIRLAPREQRTFRCGVEFTTA